MANPNPKPPPEHSRFKKGNNANPLGGKAQNPALRAIRNLTENEMIEIGSLVVKGSLKELKAVKDDPRTSVLKAMMASVAIRTIAKGDAHALEVLLNRLIGRVKERVEVISQNNTSVSGEIGVYDATKLKAAIAKLQGDV